MRTVFRPVKAVAGAAAGAWRVLNRWTEAMPRYTQWLVEVERAAKAAKEAGVVFDRKVAYETAARNVKAFHYDLRNLTDKEREILQRAIPFYAWTSRNIPAQLVNVMQQPGRFQNLTDIINAASTGGFPEEGTVPAWAESRLPIRAGEYIVPTERMLPIADVYRLEPGSALRKAWEMFNPFGVGGIAMNMLNNYDPYFREKIKTGEGVRVPFAGGYHGERAVYLARQFRPARELAGLFPSGHARYSEMPFSMKAARLTTGVKSYYAPVQQQAQTEVRSIQDRQRQITRDMNRAAAAGRQDEVEALALDFLTIQARYKGYREHQAERNRVTAAIQGEDG
jgi:hypothetical protein